MTDQRSRFFTACLMGTALLTGGCAHHHDGTSQPGAIAHAAKAPRTMLADEAIPASQADKAKLVFRSKGMPMSVMFWQSTSAQACGDFQPVGAVFDSGRGVLLPWIANLTEKLNRPLRKVETSRVQYVEPGTPVQVKALTKSVDQPTSMSPVQTYSCGPIVTSFNPEKAHAYLVEFDFQGMQSCSQHVTDITDAAHPVPVEPQAPACGIDSADATGGTVHVNYLKADHEQRLAQARKKEGAATLASDKAFAMQDEAAELDSLGQSDEALAVVDRALRMLDPSKSKDVVATKAGILFNLNQPQAALDILAPQLEATRKFADGQASNARASALSTYTEGFVTATFCYMQLEQWGNAIKTLADTESLLEGPSFSAYKSLLYRYIMARAHDPSLADSELEKRAAYYTVNDKGHYGALLRMWQGEDTVKETAKIIGAMSGADQQEAFGESLFYGGAYAKFVKGNDAGAKAMLADLDQVAPYGSIEWIYGKRVLQ
ncbi:hypothetical protein FAZ95_12630 [Trinickia violacea]|uniref:Tetratricopeptide repeat protein n=1 Tax=Trinickia violacea TaxID=2571746 RepID=A0A4P8ILZ1_9BURK|nr:hypothetical protein [Trinickia violacea]QCP49948.1 hypothetical protein FAZ95_12630 [Trinickia violacea]